MIAARSTYAQVASINIDSSSVQGTVSPLIFGNNIEWAWFGDGIWDSQKNDFKTGIPSLLDSLKIGIVRFPGGSLSDAYMWRYGIGDPGTRGYNPDSDGNMQKSAFGTNEFYRLIKAAASEGLITVNAGTGTAEDAANWVEYCNGSSATTWGKVRAQNGYPEPFNIKYWELGNELYGTWEPGNCDITTYTRRVVAFAKAMKQKDPSIKLGAVAMMEAGGVGARDTSKGWNRTLLKNAGDFIDFLCIHPYEPCINGQNIAFFSNATRVLSFDVPLAGRYSIKITARGTPLDHLFPIMECRIDNRPLSRITVNSESPKEFTFTDQIDEGRHQLAISFINDAYKPPQDRNLFISRVEVQRNSTTAQQINLADETELFKATMASPNHAELQIQELKALIKTVLPQRSSSLMIAATEYNALYGTEPSQLVLSADFKSALLAADLIHVFLRNQLYIANFWSLIDNVAFGCIKEAQMGLTRRPSFHALSLLSSHKGNSLLTVVVTVPRFSSNMYGDSATFKNVPYLSVVATLNQEKTKIVLSVINKHESHPIKARVALANFIPTKSAKALTLSAPSVNASNEQNPETVRPEEMTLNVSPQFTYSFPSRSLTIIELTSGSVLQPPRGLKTVLP
jgi:alpha-L-arabinofuranosidase